MHFSTLLTTSVLLVLALSSPAPPLGLNVSIPSTSPAPLASIAASAPAVGLPVSIPAIVPTPVASLAASALANLPVSIPVALPTAVPSTGGESSVPTDLIPHLGIPPATLLNNIEAALDILGIVTTLLDPTSALPEDIALPPERLGGATINGELVTTLVTLATRLLSLAPGGAAATGADVPK